MTNEPTTLTDLVESVRDLLAILDSEAMMGLASFAFVHNYKCCSDEETERNIATIELAKKRLASVTQ